MCVKYGKERGVVLPNESEQERDRVSKAQDDGQPAREEAEENKPEGAQLSTTGGGNERQGHPRVFAGGSTTVSGRFSP